MPTRTAARQKGTAKTKVKQKQDYGGGLVRLFPNEDLPLSHGTNLPVAAITGKIWLIHMINHLKLKSTSRLHDPCRRFDNSLKYLTS